MSQVKIEIDNDSGFCFGVVTAITKAEEELDNTGRLYCLGDIVHNSDEVDRLCNKGLITITHNDMSRLNNVKVLLRAHGEPPATYELANRNNIEIIDATCPVVLQLQRRIKRTYDSLNDNTQIVIYGKIGHAEVNGLVGQTQGKAIVVENIDDLQKINFDNNIALYSQTTKSPEGFAEIVAEINRRKNPTTIFEYYDTICRQVSGRVSRLQKFASSHQLILFVSGKKSSNGKILYEQCRAVNPLTHLISNADELNPKWLQDINSIGICGATSTPRWLMEKVKEHIESILSNG